MLNFILNKTIRKQRDKLTDPLGMSQGLYLHIRTVSCFSERFKMSAFDI